MQKQPTKAFVQTVFPKENINLISSHFHSATITRIDFETVESYKSVSIMECRWSTKWEQEAVDIVIDDGTKSKKIDSTVEMESGIVIDEGTPTKRADFSAEKEPMTKVSVSTDIDKSFWFKPLTVIVIGLLAAALIGGIVFGVYLMGNQKQIEITSDEHQDDIHQVLGITHDNLVNAFSNLEYDLLKFVSFVPTPPEMHFFVRYDQVENLAFDMVHYDDVDSHMELLLNFPHVVILNREIPSFEDSLFVRNRLVKISLHLESRSVATQMELFVQSSEFQMQQSRIGSQKLDESLNCLRRFEHKQWNPK